MALCLAPVSTLAVAAEAVPAAAPPAAWWEGFADPVLSSLEQRALAQNLDLAMTAQQVMTARAALRIAGAKGLPTVGASASYDREQASAQGILSLLGTQSPSTTSASGADPFGSTAATGTGGPAFNLYQAGIDASWEIDLWGKARAARRAARADMLAAAYGHDAAALALGAEVARSYLALRGLEQTIAITREGIDVVSRGFEIARRRESEGAVSHMDGAQAQADLQAYRARLPELEQQRQVLANALALLTGQMPHTLDALLAGNHPTTVWQNAVPDSLPADIARQRPDIAAAEASLQAAGARVREAKADFYPTLSLTGSAGLQSVSLADLPEWGARQFIVGPTVHLPFFAGGALKGHLELTRAQERRAALAYRQTVLKAWGEVDDAMGEARARQRALVALDAAVAASQDAARVARNRYREGAASYVDVLLAQRGLLANQLQLAQGQTQAATAIVALHNALGGGWKAPAKLAAK
ncbi:MAG TPA: efflux transporter outer membrane subunit [Novosphingobium sp.]|nr:efflux transporter outer membrane subunit [Novosphingobium sp.]